MTTSLASPAPQRTLTDRLLAVSGSARLARRLLSSYLDRIDTGNLVVRFEDGSEVQFGRAGQQPAATLQVHSPRFYPRVAVGGDLGFAESFMAGEWSCDDLTQLLRIFVVNRDALDNLEVSSSWLYRRLARLGHLLRGNSLRGSRRNIRDHYDLGNEMFATFLDESMTYSCAVFEPESASLRAAQERKLDRMIELAELDSSHHVLEIGCGWGSFARRAVERTGCRVTCLTLSQEQKEWCEARAREEGLEDRIEVHLRDYRQEPGSYDRIVSIEMLEAVGRDNLHVYFRRCEELLRPGGRAAIQVITIDDELYEDYSRNADFIQRYIFPGGHLPARGVLRSLVDTATSLRWHVDHPIGPHYATTLARWRERFLTHAGRIRGHGFDESFVRRWHYYFSYCEAGFLAGTIDTLQIAIDKRFDGGEEPSHG